MNNEVLEQLKQEYNETLKRAQDIGEIIANYAEMDTNHCGQDADEHQPAGYTYKDLLGMEVMFVFPRCHKCEYCTFREGPNGSECPCVKVELVGGDYICLAKHQQEESTTEIDDSPKSFEEAYRDSMNLLREFCIKQSEANQRLVEALKEESEELKRPVISFDEEEHKVFTHHGNCDVSRRINEKNLSTYQEALADAVHDVKANGATHFSCPFAVLVAQREIEIEANPMQEIKRKADDFMEYLDSVVKG